MDFRALPARPDHPRYLKRFKDIDHLLRQRKDRLVEEGMVKDRATAIDDLYWFCRRFTSFESYKVTERGHPHEGELWIDHPFVFWLCRQYQAVYDEPAGSDFWPDGVPGWVWIKLHRLAVKTTLLLASFLWMHARDETKTILLVTHKADEIGTGMGRGLLAEIQTPKLGDHFEQFRNMREARKQGYVVDRPPGPREQSLMIASVVASVTSVHPDIYAFDDAVSDKLRDNPGQIAAISKNISAYAALMTPDAPVIVCNTPWDEADPWVQREKEGLFAKVIRQAATTGGDFTPVGEPNMHTAKFFKDRRRKINDDSIYFPQFELVFHKSAATVFDWAWMKEYLEDPEDIARASPYINIIVDGAKGTSADYTVIRVITWTAHDRWANLDLIREKIGVTKAMQILIGRDVSDPTTKWIEEDYGVGGVSVVGRWMAIDPKLTIWFDDHGNAGWMESFHEHCRLRRITFGGKMPTVRKWPEIHKLRTGTEKAKRDGYTKFWRIRQLEQPYQQGKVAYPVDPGFRHGSRNGVGGGPDRRDTKLQFQQDEFNRMKLDALPPNDDLLDSESVVALKEAQILMRRPAAGEGLQLGGVVYPAPTTSNPWGLPGGGHSGTMKDMHHGRTWVSLL